jgi:uncharacterized protein
MAVAVDDPLRPQRDHATSGFVRTPERCRHGRAGSRQGSGRLRLAAQVGRGVAEALGRARQAGRDRARVEPYEDVGRDGHHRGAVDGETGAACGGQRRGGVVERRVHVPARYRRGAVPHAYVALLLIHLHFPDSESLKEKRKELSSVKAQLRTRLGVAVSEVDGQDTWQRSTLAGALTSGSFKQLAQAADHVEAWLLSRYPEGVRVERSLTSFEDAGGIG